MIHIPCHTVAPVKIPINEWRFSTSTVCLRTSRSFLRLEIQSNKIVSDLDRYTNNKQLLDEAEHDFNQCSPVKKILSI